MLSVGQIPYESTSIHQIFENIVTDEDEVFKKYLSGLNLIDEPGLFVLSMKHHYYFDQNDLKEVKIMIVLKKLNLIRHLDSFLHILYRILPPKALFIGSFSDAKSAKHKGLTFYPTSVIYDKFLNLIDTGSFHKMDKEHATKLLESHGFKIVDTTRINGQVFFTCMNKRVPA